MDNIVKERLLSLGIEVSEEDEKQIEYIEKCVDEYLKNVYDIEKNEQIAYSRADFICSKFLAEKKTDFSQEETSRIVKSITEGDISISYGDFDYVIDKLGDESAFKRYKKVTW